MFKDESLAEAQDMYDNARRYYEDLKADERLPNSALLGTMLDKAEKTMLDAYKHLLDMRYKAASETNTYSVGNI